MRRGRDTANHVFGNQASVLVGDYLYSRSFQMMVSLDDLRIQGVMADATNTIAMGEVLQLMNAHDPDTPKSVISRSSTARRPSSSRRGPRCGDPRKCTAAGRAGDGGLRPPLGTCVPAGGRHARLPGQPRGTGEDLGDDLAEGKPTLPLIHALSHSPPEEAARIRARSSKAGSTTSRRSPERLNRRGALSTLLGSRSAREISQPGALADLPDFGLQAGAPRARGLRVSRTH